MQKVALNLHLSATLHSTTVYYTSLFNGQVLSSSSSTCHLPHLPVIYLTVRASEQFQHYVSFPGSVHFTFGLLGTVLLFSRLTLKLQSSHTLATLLERHRLVNKCSDKQDR